MIKPIFTEMDHLTWKTLFEKQSPLRYTQIIPEFSQGLKVLGIDETKIPDLDIVNKKLQAMTGWQGVFVSGFEEPKSFFKMLSEKKFPIGSFIRNIENLSYTPEPDIFHDLYGHLPFFTILEYAQFCQEFGTRALKYIDQPNIVEEFQRLFWFAIEFGLIDTAQGTRIFGAGIASSFSECDYALSLQPKVVEFDLETIRKKPFRIDLLQDTLFKFKSANDLYQSLEAFEKKYMES